ncbi:papain-like cysteine protease family protein [Nocardia sp. NPDC049149]|uniref:papain-like cysteine protease family protein n=1 Tax=Nocardia sp. NPDC049149 TaxID=3364315 RepID=UPI0037157B16
MRLERKRIAPVIVAVMATVLLGHANSAAAPAPDEKDFSGRPAGLKITTGLPAVMEPRAAASGSRTLWYFQRVQEFNQWCWAADGASIANYHGRAINQNEYCKLVHGVGPKGKCPNENASLEEVATAFGKLGFNASVGSPFSMATIADEISSNRPILTGIAWAAGGGHAQVIYGYDADAGTITYGDPWPSAQRRVTQTLTSYTQNSQWIWFGEDYRIMKK